jgi:hypothetical protein
MTTPQHPDALTELMALAIEAADCDATGYASPMECARVSLAALTAAGYRIIQTDAAEHGDELVRASDEVEAGEASPRFALRRPVGNEQDTPQVPEQEHTP